MALSERAPRLLSDATDFAGNDHVTPLHLFWTMLGEQQGDVAELLSRYDFNRELVAKAIRTRDRR
jgi:hypothetical protein